MFSSHIKLRMQITAVCSRGFDHRTFDHGGVLIAGRLITGHLIIIVRRQNELGE